MSGDAREIAGKLTKAQHDDLTTHWNEFSDADPLTSSRDLDEYLADIARAGFAELRPVDADALEDPFAWERGIEPGGMMWSLTDLGLAVRAILLEQNQ